MALSGLWVIGIGVIVVAALAFLAFSFRSRRSYRNKPIEFSRKWLTELVSSAEGSFVELRDEGQLLSVRFTKEADTGGVAQRIRLMAQDSQIGRRLRDALVEAAQGLGLEVDEREITEEGSMDVGVVIAGTREAVPTDAIALLKRVAREIGLGNETRFSFNIDLQWDEDVTVRTKRRLWEEAAQSESPIRRKAGRRMLERIDREQQE